MGFTIRSGTNQRSSGTPSYGRWSSKCPGYFGFTLTLLLFIVLTTVGVPVPHIKLKSVVSSVNDLSGKKKKKKK